MPRGSTPRQPSRTGHQEGARVARAPAQQAREKNSSAVAKTPGASPRGRGGAPVPTRASVSPRQGKKKTGSGPAYNPLAPDRIAEILKQLDQMYPGVTCALTHSSAWELLVATILSAQSTDANVNRVTPEVFRKYPRVEAFAALTPEQLEPDVRSTGFFRNKSKSVVGAAKKIVSDFGGQVPDDMKELLTLP